MNFASSLSQKDLAVMGGNAMHVQVVGVAMLLALFLVDWEKCQDPPLGAPAAPVVAKLQKPTKHLKQEVQHSLGLAKAQLPEHPNGQAVEGQSKTIREAKKGGLTACQQEIQMLPWNPVGILKPTQQST